MGQSSQAGLPWMRRQPSALHQKVPWKLGKGRRPVRDFPFRATQRPKPVRLPMFLSSHLDILASFTSSSPPALFCAPSHHRSFPPQLSPDHAISNLWTLSLISADPRTHRTHRTAATNIHNYRDANQHQLGRSGNPMVHPRSTSPPFKRQTRTSISIIHF